MIWNRWTRPFESTDLSSLVMPKLKVTIRTIFGDMIHDLLWEWLGWDSLATRQKVKIATPINKLAENEVKRSARFNKKVEKENTAQAKVDKEKTGRSPLKTPISTPKKSKVKDVKPARPSALSRLPVASAKSSDHVTESDIEGEHDSSYDSDSSIMSVSPLQSKSARKTPRETPLDSPPATIEYVVWSDEAGCYVDEDGHEVVAKEEDTEEAVDEPSADMSEDESSVNSSETSSDDSSDESSSDDEESGKKDFENSPRDAGNSDSDESDRHSDDSKKNLEEEQEDDEDPKEEKSGSTNKFHEQSTAEVAKLGKQLHNLI